MARLPRPLARLFTLAFRGIARHQAPANEAAPRNGATADAAPETSKRRAPARLIVPWQPAQLTRVQDGLPGRYQLFTDLGATLGLREGEAFGCCLEDFTGDMTDYRIRQQVKRVPGGRAFAPPKHGRERSVPVPPDLRQSIRDHIAVYGTVKVTLPWEPDGKPRTRTLLLATQSGTSLDRAYFGRLLDAALTAAGIELTRDNKTHMLRHLAASRWIAAGADLVMVSELLGHADLATTQAYVKRLATHDARTRRVVAKAQPRTRRTPGALPAGVADFTAYRSRRSS